MQATRAWPDDVWNETRSDLRDRGLLDQSGRLTGLGAEFRGDIESRTDQVALAPWAALGPERCNELRALVRPLSRAIVDGGAFSR